MNKQKGVLTYIILIIVGLVIVVGGGFLGYQYLIKLQIGSTDETAGWKTYTNTQYGFKFKYPSNFDLVGEELAYNDYYYIGFRETKYKDSDASYRRGESIEYRLNYEINSLKKINGEYGSYFIVVDREIIKDLPLTYMLKTKYYYNDDTPFLDENNNEVFRDFFVVVNNNDLLIFETNFLGNVYNIVNSVQKI